MATQPSEEQGRSNHAEPAVDIEDVWVSGGSASSQSRGGASEKSENEVGGPDYRTLLRAAFAGDWESVNGIFNEDSASKTAKITSRSETVLHIAALSAHDKFLEKLVELLSPKEQPDPGALEMVDDKGRTALHNAVLSGRITMVEELVTRNPRLTQLADNDGYVPLAVSSLEASMHKEIAWFLAEKTTNDGPSHPFGGDSGIGLILCLIYAGHHDIALYLVNKHDGLLTMRHTTHVNPSILHALAVLPHGFPSGTRLGVLEALIYKCVSVDLSSNPTDKNSDSVLQYLTRSLWNATKFVVPIIKRVHEVKMRHMAAAKLAEKVCDKISSENIAQITQFISEDLLFQATVKGINEMVKLCIKSFPELFWISPRGHRLMVHAVTFRQERTLGLFLKVSSTNELSLDPAPTQEESKDMLSEAVKYDPRLNAATNVAGAAFQLQRELQWFKAVEKWIIPVGRYHLTEIQGKKKTYWEIFVEEHKGLLENGEKWVKDTANSCMLVSTLIATVLFAAAFTMPGGNDDQTGVPLLSGQDSFLVFAISDALGLFSSVTAILLFLAILTSRYEPQDFLESLPRKIVMGLCFLFLSLAFMLVAFAATLTMVLGKRLEWVLIPVTLLASLPVALFVLLQLPLLYQMVKSTYGPSIFRAEDIWK